MSVQVFPDLSTDSLAKWGELKLITMVLNAVNLCYKWTPSSSLYVRHQGAAFVIYDLESCQAMLQELSIALSSDLPKKSYKRQLDFSLSPLKWSKISV